MADIITLIPGGNTVFYGITKDGKLNWYQFTGNASKPLLGPITVGSGFGAYQQVLGGSDGVIYAVENDGTLLWFRHEGFASGSGIVSAPKTVGSGWGQFRQVFAAGHGILYGVKPDGTVSWYRHRDYLTGDSATPGNAAAVKGSREGARATDLSSFHSHQTSQLGANTAPQISPSQNSAHWDGPVLVASGWPEYAKLFGAGDGAVLALQRDGKLQWYRLSHGHLGGSERINGARRICENLGLGSGVGGREFSRRSVRQR
jgi:hypothetical protein